MVSLIVITSLSILGMLICIIFFPRIKYKNISIETYWMPPLIGAILVLSLNLIPFDSFISNLIKNTSINPLEILALFLSMTLISIMLDEVGFFEKLATIVVRKAKANQYLLFLFLYLLVSILTIFTSNDIIVITLTPFIIFFCKNTKINPIPYLISEFVAANTWSMLLIIGNPTNIYLGSSFNITFFEYIKVMYLPTIFAGFTSLIIMYLLFRKSLKQKMEIMSSVACIKDKFLFIVSLVLLCLCILFMAISSFINFPMWLIATISASLLILITILYMISNHSCFKIVQNTIKRMPFSVIPFILSMFTFVLAFNEIGITQNYVSLLDSINNPIISYGFSSFLIANLINNIPMSVFYSSVLSVFSLNIRALYSVIISSNIAAFFTPLGALAGIMWMTILKDKNLKMSFLKFTLYGALISVPTLLMSFLGLFIATL